MLVARLWCTSALRLGSPQISSNGVATILLDRSTLDVPDFETHGGRERLIRSTRVSWSLLVKSSQSPAITAQQERVEFRQ